MARAPFRVGHGPAMRFSCLLTRWHIGTEYLDTVTLGVGLAITQQSIGVASRASGFSGVDGILGYVAYRLLTRYEVLIISYMLFAALAQRTSLTVRLVIRVPYQISITLPFFTSYIGTVSGSE